MGQSRRSDRPPPTTRQHKRRNITFRVTDAIYDQLCFAADWAGRSLSEEIESRLEGSFLPGALLDRVAAGELELVITRDRKTQPTGVLLAKLPGDDITTISVALTAALTTLNDGFTSRPTFLKKTRPRSILGRSLEQTLEKLRLALAALPGTPEYERLHPAADAPPAIADPPPSEDLITPLTLPPWRQRRTKR
jgi:hypothetical protein